VLLASGQRGCQGGLREKGGGLVAAGMEFGLLGALAVHRDGAVVAVPPGSQRVLLAALLLKANRAVPLDELAEAVWGTDPPASARATLQSYVMRLRRSLGDIGPGRITTQPGGYQISVAAGELDVTRCEALVRTARAEARDGSWEEAAGQSRAALALWRGEPLADVESELLALREVPRLTELRLQTLELRIDADLHLGRHGEVIGELQQLTAAHPLRERFHGLLMLALYRDGRQGEALAAYARARRVLIDELGAEPGTGLRELHQQMLTADPALDLPRPGPTVADQPGPAVSDQPGTAVSDDPGLAVPGGPGPAVPRELPAGIRHFTGRGGELKQLTALLDHTSEETPTVVISAIGGTAGVGKTALAVQWAHQVTERFPDGQLYVNLRGYDPAQPVTAADALARFLRALGVAGRDIPAEEDERAARYRSLLTAKRMLVVLDNAGKAEQVRPLLPGSPGCVVLVTSRDALAGLIARDGAHRLDLDLLPQEDAVGLLRALIGERVDADPGAAAVLAGRCARLPLALRVVAEFAAARPDVSLAGLADELADQQRRLDLLEAGGDPRTAVRAVFSWSYRHLDAEAARAFRLAGLHPGPSFEPYALAALTGATLQDASRLLEALARAHLIQPAGPGRYGLHDLLRAYAAGQAHAIDTGQERRAALTGLFDHYLHTAATAMDSLVPAERDRRPRIPPPAAPTPPLPDPDTARAWLDAQRATLTAVVTYTAEHGWPGHATRLATTVARYLDYGGHYPEAISIHTHARHAARDSGDRAAEATALSNLGVVDWWQGRYQQATGHYQQALTLYRATGDQAGQAIVLGNLGVVDLSQGRYQQATDHYQQALTLYRATGDQASQANALGNLGAIAMRQGRYQQAAHHHQQALTLYRELGNRAGEAYALTNLGGTDVRQGRYQQAARHHQQALALFRELGNRSGEANVLTNLGAVDLSRGRCQQAVTHHQEALTLFRELGDRAGEAEALNGLGDALLVIGQPEDARAQHAIALGVASQIGDKFEQARAHNGLAHVFHATGDPGQARHHWQQALTVYTELGAPEAGDVRARLTAAQGAEPRDPHPPAGRSG
jgi:DNA-binding SARP family transcriptional activator/tetratricopeptide (TPR) repeat protein